MLHSKSLMKECFWEKWFHLKVFGFLTIFFWQACQGCILRYNMNSIYKKCLSRNFIIVEHFHVSDQKITSFLWAFGSGVGKTALYVSRGNRWADVSFEKLLELYFLSDFQRKIIWQFKLLLSELFLPVQKKKIFVKVVLYKKFCRCLKTSIRNSSEFQRNFLGMVVKAAF